MAGPLSWTVLFLTISFGAFSVEGNNKGLIVSTFPSWAVYAQLQVYHNDPSTFKTNTSTSKTRISLSGNTKITSLVANTGSNSLLVLDANTNTIYNYENFNLHMNHTSRKFSKVHTGVSATTSQIAVDWYTGNVYWTDGFYKYVATHPLRFPDNTSVYKILISRHLTKPEGIAVDPDKRYLFWSDVIGAKSKIERSSTTGSHRTVIVQSSNPIWISSLALDTDNEKIYWADGGRQTVEYCNYDGSDRKVLRRILHAAFLSITMSKDVVCGTEYNYRNVMCLDKSTGNTTWFSSYTYRLPWAIAVFDNEQQKITSTKNPCHGHYCSHMCFNTDANTATCGCKEGYKLMADNKSCKNVDGLIFGKSIIITNSTDACMYDIHIATRKKQPGDCFLTNMTDLTFFSVDSHERVFYYVDHSMSSIKTVNMITKIEQILYVGTVGDETISGLSYDWNTKNIYWTDSQGGKILFHSTSTDTTTELLTQLDTPKYITVSPHLRKMFWITGSGRTSTLEEGNFDVSGLKTLLGHGKISYPKALFYDDKSEKLYWINNGNLVSMKPDGSNPVYHAYTRYATHVLVYKDYSYWTTGHSYLLMAHLDSRYRNTYLSTDMGSLTAVGVYDVDVQPKEKNNCTNFNGGCQHICQPTGTTTMQCFCDFGYKLQGDGKRCSNDPFKHSFAILPDVTHSKLFQVHLSDGEIRALDIPDIDVPVSAIFDKPTDKIYWTNALTSEIRASTLKSTTSELIYTKSRSVSPIGLAFDYSSGLLYFTTEHRYNRNASFIGCIHPHVGLVKTLITDLDIPKNIALYPKKGMMFWTDIAATSTSTSYIGSAFMDGTNMKKIVTAKINSPNGIVIDYVENRIYWADAVLSIIESVDLTGKQRKTVIAEAGAGLVGLDISPPYLYYVGRNKQRISKYDMSSKHKVQFMNDIHALGRIESVRVYPEQTQPKNTHCATKNGGCALFCLPIPTGRICGCEDGHTLKHDGTSCDEFISCDTNIPNAILSDRCIGHATGKCNFTCANGYEKTIDILECKKDGTWNHHINTVCQSLTGTCTGFIAHGHVSPECDKKINSICTYTCSAGYVPDPNNTRIQCLASGAWSKPVDQLCTTANVYCPKTINNGQLASTCTSAAGSVCDFSCNPGYNNTVVTNVVCLNDGKWNTKDEVCIPKQSGTIADSGKQNEGTSNGAVAGIVVATIILTTVIVLGIAYFVWWRKKPQETSVFDNINVKFNRFDDANVPADQGVIGFSNPIASQPEYGKFSNLRDEGYIATNIATPYDAADPKYDEPHTYSTADNIY